MFGVTPVWMYGDCYDRFLRESEDEYDNMNAW